MSPSEESGPPADAQPVSFNPFRVPVPYSREGLPTVVKWEVNAPLAAWLVHGHSELWVPVDHTEAQFDWFVETGPDPDVLAYGQDHGHVVVVNGAQGTGKTSLINRCVDDLGRRLAPLAPDGVAAAAGYAADQLPGAESGPTLWVPRGGYPGVEILPIGDFRNVDNGYSRNNGRKTSVEELNRKIAKTVLRKLAMDKGFEQGFDDPRKESEDLGEVYEAISTRLGLMNRILLVIVPDMMWLGDGLTTQFISSFHTYAHPSVVFFLETSHKGLRGELEKEFRGVYEPHYTLLEMSSVNAEDWDIFIGRRTVVNGLPGASIVFADEVIQNRPERHLYRNVRDLQGFLHDMSSEAIEHRENAVRLNRLELVSRRRAALNLSALKF
ncbi:hypothetical protein [Streptomyces uncialis]|uniref:Uncharacterized protein n=1 Tax=Streptomyces uncialis TaxID=1048205 RepID=A0A1Q4V429_9ACTN|nr:hypothetical protein [Streptomyces uncialis]MCX4662735.1 hypothetical protein [Streptomyces uncialis]OKH92564.1 hypothetical protein AB852_23180 [Streptomyces uncialis]WST71390.1 hypothetical protein OG268_30595 [Streptomyces uncialis]WTE09947.1 hypothetical protein OG924_06250 [Streptomyces uncialis]